MGGDWEEVGSKKKTKKKTVVFNSSPPEKKNEKTKKPPKPSPVPRKVSIKHIDAISNVKDPPVNGFRSDF
jgi:hypothetical protein